MARSGRRHQKPDIDQTVLASFHERFNIPVGVDEAKRRFLNRVDNAIFGAFLDKDGKARREALRRTIATALGEKYSLFDPVEVYVRGDFHKCLQAIEATYEASYASDKNNLSALVSVLLGMSEVDLGITWQRGRFVRTGARLLDKELVNEPLRWLSAPNFESVYDPFAKGLSHFLEAGKRPELLYDTVTDMYESLEALSRIVTGRSGKDLSANAELFIKKIGCSQHYKPMLKNYIDYANDFRHALEQGEKRPILSTREVESFIYLTGLFIRLAIGETQTPPE